MTMAITIAKTGRSMKKSSHGLTSAPECLRPGFGGYRASASPGAGRHFLQALDNDGVAGCSPARRASGRRRGRSVTTVRASRVLPVDDHTVCRPCNSCTAFCGTRAALALGEADAHAAELAGQQRCPGLSKRACTSRVPVRVLTPFSVFSMSPGAGWRRPSLSSSSMGSVPGVEPLEVQELRLAQLEADPDRIERDDRGQRLGRVA